MKFIFDEGEFEAINVAFIEKNFVSFYVEDNFTYAFVKAETTSGQFTLKTFNTGNREKNINAAKDYLADLIRTLNA